MTEFMSPGTTGTNPDPDKVYEVGPTIGWGSYPLQGKPELTVPYKKLKQMIEGRMDFLYGEQDGLDTSQEDKYASIRIQLELRELLSSIQDDLLTDDTL